MAALIGLFVGAIAGNLVWHEWGAIAGGLIGFFAGVMLSGNRMREAHRKPLAGGPFSGGAVRDGASLQARVGALEQRVRELEQALRDVRSAPAAAHGADVVSTELPAAAPAGEPVGVHADEAARVSAAAMAMPAPRELESPKPRVAARTGSRPLPAAGAPEVPAAITPPPTAPRATANALWAWFTGGNALTRIGVVVLFFGVAFLLRYLAEHFEVPIEAKLMAVAAVGIALIALGLRTAAARPAYGVSLQGAGAGVLYLTTYAAFRLFDVLPAHAALAVLVGVSALAVWLAVRADSQSLAGLAVAGGFLAPMLAGGGGGPVALFGYFAVLNGAILAIAWRRAWRALNVLGFVFTFVLGVFWGHAYYRPEHFAVVEPFLALFFAFYVAIAILYAWRGRPEATVPVDGVLVFGVPLVGFALQLLLVRDTRYGAAWSAVAIAVVYAGAWVALRRRAEPALGLLAQAFLALAVIFATVAVPFAFDARWTTAYWAVEGAGVFWLGCRQRQPLACAFGLVLQVAAGVMFAAAGLPMRGETLFLNASFTGSALIALAAFATAFVADRHRAVMDTMLPRVAVPVLVWGVLWWIGGGSYELVRELSRWQAPQAVLAWVAASAAVALGLARALRWPRLAGMAAVLLPVMAIVAARDLALVRTTLTYGGWLVFPLAWLVHALALRTADRAAPAGDGTTASAHDRERHRVVAIVHSISAVGLVAQLSWESSEWVGRWTPWDTVWVACAAALPAIAFLALVSRARDAAWWPLGLHREAYAIGAGAPLVGLLAIWFLAVNAWSSGAASPLPYFPLANPLDVTLGLALAVLFVWSGRHGGVSERARYGGLGIGVFVALNGIVMRTGHHWLDIPWRLSSLLASKPLQAALTLAWTVTGVALMVGATRRGLRPLWMVGAGLLAVVVAKLFAIDLAALAGLPRVVAFLGVGVLLLLIGYLSPLPPAARDPAPGPPASSGA
jgi:uncharacterized membrane protein